MPTCPLTPLHNSSWWEGWIESGWPPKVILTRSFTVNAGIKYKKDDLQSSIARGARVYVSDGEDSVRLSGKWDFDYFPPYVYTTGRMIGEEGKTYRLTVDYDGFHAEAATTIPSAPDSVRCRPSALAAPPPADHPSGPTSTSAVDADTAACQISVAFKNNPDEGCGYVCFLNSDVASQQLYASYLGVVDGANMSADAEVPMFRPHHSGEKNYSLYYSSSDTVHAKISSVDEPRSLSGPTFRLSAASRKSCFFPLITACAPTSRAPSATGVAWGPSATGSSCVSVLSEQDSFYQENQEDKIILF